MGIVPIEAMSLGCLVIACNRGAQLESISHDYTGFVLPENEQIWGEQIRRILGSEQEVNKSDSQIMSSACKYIWITHTHFLILYRPFSQADEHRDDQAECQRACEEPVQHERLRC